MANFPLDLRFPKAPGAAGTGLDSNHKVYSAYPGSLYRYFAAAGGGEPPHTFSLSGQPAGMAIDAATGEVTWPNPTLGTHTGITVSVTDQALDSDSATYDLVVTTTPFRWIDAVNGSDANDGILVADGGTGPWASLAKLYDQTNLATAFVYFLNGTYTFAGVPVVDGGTAYDARWQFSQSTGQATTWLAVPGATVTLDFESDHTLPTNYANPDPTQSLRDGGYRPALRMSGDRTYVDGLIFLDGFNKFLWMDRGVGRGLTVINNIFRGLGPGRSTSNAACVMFTHQQQTFNDVIVNNDVEDIGGGDNDTCFIKAYDNMEAYLAFNRAKTNITVADSVIALKDSCGQYMCYRNEIVSAGPAQGGNNHQTAPYTGTFGETWFSRLKSTTYALEFNQDAQAHEMYWERCTLEGRIHALGPVATAHGPFVFRNCVGVNGDDGESPVPFVHDEPTITDTSRLSIPGGLTPTGTENLLGPPAAAIVDANGNLQNTYREAFLGSKGWEFGDAPSLQRGGHRGRVAIF